MVVQTSKRNFINFQNFEVKAHVSVCILGLCRWTLDTFTSQITYLYLEEIDMPCLSSKFSIIIVLWNKCRGTFFLNDRNALIDVKMNENSDVNIFKEWGLCAFIPGATSIPESRVPSLAINPYGQLQPAPNFTRIFVTVQCSVSWLSTLMCRVNMHTPLFPTKFVS